MSAMGQELGMYTNRIRLTWSRYIQEFENGVPYKPRATDITMFPKKIKCVIHAGDWMLYTDTTSIIIIPGLTVYFHGETYTHW